MPPSSFNMPPSIKTSQIQIKSSYACSSFPFLGLSLYYCDVLWLLSLPLLTSDSLPLILSLSFSSLFLTCCWVFWAGDSFFPLARILGFSFKIPRYWSECVTFWPLNFIWSLFSLASLCQLKTPLDLDCFHVFLDFLENLIDVPFVLIYHPFFGECTSASWDSG